MPGGEAAVYTYTVANGQYWYSDAATVEVAYEDECQAEAGDDDAPSGGCSLGQPTSGADLPAVLSLAMALLGAVALFLGRNRRQA